MISLLLSIIFSTYLIFVFKVFKRYGIDNLQGIVANYISCIATGIIISGRIPTVQLIHEDWFPFAAFLGLNFFVVFNLMGFVAANIGVTLTAIASKLSMVIPVTVAIILYHQQVTVIKIAALLLAIVAVSLSSISGSQAPQGFYAKGLLLAFLIFIGSGINDSVVNYAYARFLNPEEFDLFNISIFSAAAIIGLITMVFRRIFMGKVIQLKAIIGGILLGVPNYFSLLFLLKALTISRWESSVIFPVNNMGVVVLTAVGGWFLFKEKLSAINLLGIFIGLLAIGMMIFA